MIQPKLIVTVSKTADGQNDYLQVISSDQYAVNIVLLAQEIEVQDSRGDKQAKAETTEPEKRDDGPPFEPSYNPRRG